MPDSSETDAHAATQPQRRRWPIALATVLLIGVLLGPRVWRTNWTITSRPFTGGVNTALAEAEAWRDGRLHLDGDFYEDAREGDRTYNVTGLAFAVIAYAVLTIQAALSDATTYPPWMLLALLCIIAPMVVTSAFFRMESNRWWAGIFALAFVLGTPMRIVISLGLGGSVYYMNHTLAIVGLCIVTVDVLGRRRWWPAAVGLMLAAWSRQMTLLYALPLAYLAWCDWRGAQDRAETGGDDLPSNCNKSVRSRIAVAALLATVIVAVPAGLNYLKFGNPLDSGYIRLYEGRNDGIAQRAHIALFSPRFIPMHAHAMNTAFPVPEIRHRTLHLDISATTGGSIWLTAPLTIFVPLTIRRWWPDRRRRALMLGTLPVILGVMCYHTTGAEAGFYRYALDFLPIWWLVCLPTIPRTAVTERWMATAACFGVFYFYWLRW